MRKLMFTIAVSLAFVGAAHAATDDKDKSPEAKLTKALEGWEKAGDPVKCIPQRNIRSSQIYNRTAIVYETIGGTRYVNRPASGLSSLRSGDVMVTDTRSPDLCSIDIVRMYDTAAKMQTGTIGLGEFVPYKKIEKTKAK